MDVKIGKVAEFPLDLAEGELRKGKSPAGAVLEEKTADWPGRATQLSGRRSGTLSIPGFERRAMISR